MAQTQDAFSAFEPWLHRAVLRADLGLAEQGGRSRPDEEEIFQQIVYFYLTSPYDSFRLACARVLRAWKGTPVAERVVQLVLSLQDTVANSLSFMLYALLAHPDARLRVQAEVDAAWSGGTLSWEQLKQMPDLHGAMMETLRRYPVAGSHRARVARPLTLAGYRLEQGLDVEVAMTVPHFLEELYPNPMQFDLDRFRAPRNEHRKPGTYAPFGLGDHTCLGAGIAEVQLMVTMATLLSTYTLQFDPPDYHLVIEEHPTPVPGNHFQVQVRERHTSSTHERRI